MALHDLAETGYKARMAGDRVTIPGIANKATVSMRRLIPECFRRK
jgi:short-subunit dehydrogenase